MICNIRKFKHYDSKKLTEIGFCPSVKNQVESFIQAGKVLQGAQNHLYDFKEKDFLDDNMEGESIYNDKIDCLERLNELTNDFNHLQRVKSSMKQNEPSNEPSHVSKAESENKVDKVNKSDVE